MATIYKPSDYVGVFDSPEFEVTVSSDEFFDCMIVDAEGETLGVKRMGGDLSYKVNVANYAKRGIDVSPLCGQAAGFVVPENRVYGVAVEVEDTNSGVAKISSSRVEIAENQLLSDLSLKRNIAAGESDELSFIVAQGDYTASIAMMDGNGLYSVLEDVEYTLEDGGPMVFVVNVDDLGEKVEAQTSRSLSEYVGFELAIKSEDEELASLEYELVEDDSRRVRLCWWNDHGAVDYYSFYDNGDSKVSAQKQLVKTEVGYRSECSQVEYSRQLYSKAVSKAQAQSLSKMIYAPRVWVCDASQVSQVLISTTTIEQSDGQLPTVSFEITEIEDQQD